MIIESGEAILLNECKQALLEEAKRIEDISNKLDERFLRTLDIISLCTGKIVFIGIGKSGAIAKKIAATFSSIGKPSVFLHASEAQHGDLGIINEGDIIICISNSGNTDEIIKLLPSLKIMRTPIISITRNSNSKLAKMSDIVLPTYVDKEACPLNLVPTTSAIVTLAIGDALAVGLVFKLKLTPEKFGQNHPSGNLGKRLNINIKDLMVRGDEIPACEPNSTLREALFEITTKRLGFANIIDDQCRLLGILTDGDIRRLLENDNLDLDAHLDKIMTSSPKTCLSHENAYNVLQRMNSLKVNCMPVVDESYKLVGSIHIQDLIEEFGR